MSDSPTVLDGVIAEALPNAAFRVELTGGRSVVAHVGAEMRMHTVRIVPGDKVTVELTSRDIGRARIVRRVG